ncbi:LytTR family transcriptional regulator DNA-binding domain-containing protein [Paenibacillus sp. Leaf72]|uniref:LytTR family transcriptional regulator DNA-binding domain-containing protein n=1 Tax=Paenibacillus sp. Leaf72 TaxID=1736234 RepID=UPI001F31257E|nr:LytTR family transcriptional regulator DNA-binding domain-containing protein [Paenibacillus sp. Leaf72]
MALVRHPEKPGELLNINIKDCWFIETVNRVITYHHADGKKYEAAQSFKDFEGSSHLREMKMMRMDNSNFVRIPAIKHYDQKSRTVFFENNVTEFSKMAYIARKNHTLLQNLMKSQHDHN